jgi:hypothetical protein
MLPVETFEMRKCSVYFSLAEPRENIKAILKKLAKIIDTLK